MGTYIYRRSISIIGILFISFISVWSANSIDNIKEKSSIQATNSLKNSENVIDETDIYMSEMLWSLISGWQYINWNVCAPVCEYQGKTRSLSQGNRHTSWEYWDDIWSSTLNCEKNVKKLKAEADSINDSRYLAIANIWECYSFFCFTNLNGDVPYTDYLSDKLPVLLNYDNQQDIYFSLIRKLKNAGLSITSGTENINTSSDFIFGGDMIKWKKFANTLLVRYAMYMSDAALDSSKLILNEIVNDPKTYPIMESNDDNAFYHYDGVNHKSVFYLAVKSKIEEAPFSNVFIERLVSLKDPRLPIYARPVKKVHTNKDTNIVPSNKGADKYVGHLYGITTDNVYSSMWNGGIDFASKIGEYFRTEDSTGKATSECARTPLALATYSEMLFFLAEAREKGIITNSTAKDYYENAITASFDQYNVTFSSVKYSRAFASEILKSNEEYLIQPDVNYDGSRDKLTLIAEQKWIASYLLSFEPFFDHRRTMLPRYRASSGAELWKHSGSGIYFPSGANGPTKSIWLTESKGVDWLKMPVFVEPTYKSDFPVINNDLSFGASFKEWYDNSWKSMLWWEADIFETKHICQGDSYKGYVESGIYDEYYKTNYGCDSIYTLQLIVETPSIPEISMIDGVLYSSIITGNQWYFNNSIIPGATDSSYTPTAKGNYSVKTTTNSCPSQVSESILFDPLTDVSTAISEQFKVYPNPTKGLFEIEMVNTNTNNYTIEIYNSHGRLYSTFTSKNENIIKCDLANCPAGIYFIKIRNNETNKIIKIIKD
jgi:hypothetical protein